MIYSKEVLIDEAKVRAFAELTGDDNPIHLDAAYAATTKFQRPIAHGLLVGAFISPALTTAFGDGTIYAGQSFQFLKPVYVGDTILIEFDRVAKMRDKKIMYVTTSIYTVNNGVKTAQVIAGQASFLPGVIRKVA